MFSAVHFTKTWLDIFHVAIISLGQMVRHLKEPYFFVFSTTIWYRWPFWLPFGWVPKCGSGMQPVPFGYLGSFWWTKLRQLNLWLQFAFQILALVLGVKFGCKLNSPMQFVHTLTIRLIRYLCASFCWTKYISFSSEQPLFYFSKLPVIIQSGYLILALVIIHVH